MGPAVVGLVAMAPVVSPASSESPLPGLMSVFTLVSAFAGGMGVAMDTVAGERERRSLLPLLLNPVSRWNVVLGKWLAASLFAMAGLTLNLGGFSIVFVKSEMHVETPLAALLLAVVLGIFPLALLAACIQLLLSTVCRAVKEAQTCLSMIVFYRWVWGCFLCLFPERGSRGSVLFPSSDKNFSSNV